MRIILLVLSGDAGLARQTLKDRYADGEIVDYPRSKIENGSMSERLAALRRERPNVFAVMTESLAWQYGQEALMLYGALGGASESVVLDSRGNVRAAGRGELLFLSPLRLARNFAKGKAALSKAPRDLAKLERRAVNDALVKRPRKDQEPLSVTYLRTTPAAGTLPGGATTHINGVVNGLLSLGAQVSFISNDEIAGLDKTRVAFQTIPPDPAVIPRAAFDISNGSAFSSKASTIITGSPPDLIYQRYSRFSWAGVEAGLDAGVPLFLEYNGSEVWVGKHWDSTARLDLLERYERLNLTASARIFVISEIEKQNLLDEGISAGKIIVNPNGVDTDRFKPGVGGDEIRRELGLSGSVKLIGFVGTFGPWHGVLALADAIALTPGKDLHYLMVGDGSLRPSVEVKLRETGHASRATFVGVASHERVPALLDACDILVAPHVPLAENKEFFGSPTKLFEYMAMGKGIVASRLGQIGDVLSDNETALLVEPGNVDELSAAINKLAEDTNLRLGLGDAARQTAIERHTWRQNAARVIQAYHEYLED